MQKYMARMNSVTTEYQTELQRTLKQSDTNISNLKTNNNILPINIYVT